MKCVGPYSVHSTPSIVYLLVSVMPSIRFGLLRWAAAGTLGQKCAACHGLGDEMDTVGPTLKELMDRKAGSLEDYRYSAAMKRSDVKWTSATLDTFIADPQGLIKGNRMAFAGITDPAERADLIAYLEQTTMNRNPEGKK